MNSTTFQVMNFFKILENFPKPYTKAEARMLAVEDSNKYEEVEVVVVNTDDEGISEKNEGAVVKKKKRKTKIKAKKLILNVSLTKYHVVRYVGKKLFNMRLSGYS